MEFLAGYRAGVFRRALRFHRLGDLPPHPRPRGAPAAWPVLQTQWAAGCPRTASLGLGLVSPLPALHTFLFPSPDGLFLMYILGLFLASRLPLVSKLAVFPSKGSCQETVSALRALAASSADEESPPLRPASGGDAQADVRVATRGGGRGPGHGAVPAGLPLDASR